MRGSGFARRLAGTVCVAALPLVALGAGEGTRSKGEASPFAPVPSLADGVAHADARPVIVFNMQNGEGWNSAGFLDDAADADGNGVPDGFDRLIRERLDPAYAQGWRRMLLNRTTGDLATSWDEMRPFQREAYRTAVRAWADAHPDAVLEAYIRLDDLPASIALRPDGADLGELVEAFEPYAASGFGVVWVDSGAANRQAWAAINQTEALLDAASGRRTIIGSEAYSSLLQATGDLPARHVPWIALSQNPMWPLLPQGEVTDVDRRELSVGYWVHAQPVESIGHLYAIVRTGKWVASHGDGRISAWIQRVYEFGVIDRPADFDGDGAVNINDVLTFVTQFSSHYLDAGDPMFFEGDYDRDGAVNAGDLVAFVQDYSGGGGRPVAFGPSRQPPLWGR